MSESKKDWKVVDGYYPGFLNIVGASYTVSIVTSATDLTLEDYVNRTNDAHLMAAAPDLLEALDALVKINEDHNKSIQGVIGTPPGWNDSYLDAARKALAKARGQQ